MSISPLLPVKLCKDCKHLSPKEAIVYPQCTSPSLIGLFGVDVVHGHTMSVSARAMRDARHGVACGIEAKYFEPKEPPKNSPIGGTAQGTIQNGPKNPPIIQPASVELEAEDKINK